MKKSKYNIAIINGPNLNLLGTREPQIYGTKTLKNIETDLTKIADEKQLTLIFYQSNHEGAIVDKIHEFTRLQIDFLIINPAALTHTSLSIRDALIFSKIKFIEVHISNLFNRKEEIRKHSMISDISQGIIIGLGANGYELALYAAIKILTTNS